MLLPLALDHPRDLLVLLRHLREAVLPKAFRPGDSGVAWASSSRSFSGSSVDIIALSGSGAGRAERASARQRLASPAPRHSQPTPETPSGRDSRQALWKAGRAAAGPLTAVTPQDQEALKSNSARVWLTIASKRPR